MAGAHEKEERLLSERGQGLPTLATPILIFAKCSRQSNGLEKEIRF